LPALCGIGATEERIGIAVRCDVFFMDAGADDGCGIAGADFGAGTCPPDALVVASVFGVLVIAMFSPPMQLTVKAVLDWCRLLPAKPEQRQESALELASQTE
jgi:hypothetical protein